MKEKKEKCLLCDKCIMTKKYSEKKFWREDTVHVKCSDWLDEVFHSRCWKKLKID